MKILYIGHQSDGSNGYAQAAKDYILAMDSVGIQVVPRAFRLNQGQHDVPARIVELEDRDDKNCDVVIQHTLPCYFEYNGNFKCIGMFAVENDRIPQDWVDKCNICDEIWTFCNESKRAIEFSGVTVPIHVVPHAIDLSKFQRSYPKLDIRRQYPNDVIYYSIGEFQPRKGFDLLLRAFHTALDPDDAAQLILKVNIPGKSPQETLKIVGDFCNDVKRKLRLYPNQNDYKVVHIISDHLSEDHMMALHNTGDVYVCASRGEGANMPLRNAMAMGKTVISPRHTAMSDYITYQNAYVVDSHSEPCYGHMDTLPNLSTGRQSWYNVHVDDLEESIHTAYCVAKGHFDPERNSRLGAAAMKTIFDNYGYESVGNIIRDLLNETK